MENTSDKLVGELLKVIQEKKETIAKAERPNWSTNCSFRVSKDVSTSTNLQVCDNVVELTEILGFIIEKRKAFNEAKEILGVSGSFKWLGFTFEDWVSDIKTRIAKIQISSKRKELEILEARLDKIISPELRAKMELAEIQKLLEN